MKLDNPKVSPAPGYYARIRGEIITANEGIGGDVEEIRIVTAKGRCYSVRLDGEEVVVTDTLCMNELLTRQRKPADVRIISAVSQKGFPDRYVEPAAFRGPRGFTDDPI